MLMTYVIVLKMSTSMMVCYNAICELNLRTLKLIIKKEGNVLFDDAQNILNNK